MTEPRDSLFVAIWPPPEIVSALEELPRPELDGVRWVRPEQWHVTLRFLGRIDPDLVTAAMPGFDVDLRARLGPRIGRLNPEVVCVPVHGLEPLADAVASATAELGRPPEHRRFRGHVTLARTRGRAPIGLEGRPFEAEFPVRVVTLVASRGGEYRVLATFPLTSGNA